MFNNDITVLNQSHLFRYSGLVDSLRESLDNLINKDISITLANKLSSDYSLLRNKLLSNYNEIGRAEIATWCPELSDSNSDIGLLYYSVTQLSKLTELIHQTNDFLLNQEVKVANAKEVAAQMGFTAELKEKKPSVLHFGMLY